jgi:hypothetical protein
MTPLSIPNQEPSEVKVRAGCYYTQPLSLLQRTAQLRAHHTLLSSIHVGQDSAGQDLGPVCVACAHPPLAADTHSDTPRRQIRAPPKPEPAPIPPTTLDAIRARKGGTLEPEGAASYRRGLCCLNSALLSAVRLDAWGGVSQSL